MAAFKQQIRNPVREALEPLISNNLSLDHNGNILESDADSNGNLRYKFLSPKYIYLLMLLLFISGISLIVKMMRLIIVKVRVGMMEV